MEHLQVREYSVFDINRELETLRAEYDLVRLVDAEECRIITVNDTGKTQYEAECHSVWGIPERCANCTSYRACMTHQIVEKDEIFQGSRYHIQSVPLYLRLPDGELSFCVMEKIRVYSLDGLKNPPDPTVRGNSDYHSTHDTLTGLYNQGEVFRCARKLLMAHPDDVYLLISGDIRDFHLINNLFGRERGNEVLIGIANLLRQVCTPDEVYGRIKDDRFVLFMRKDKFDQERVRRYLSNIRRMIDSPIYSMRVHLGIYEIQNKSLPLALMLERANMALHTIRHSHQQVIAYYTEGMMERQLEDQKIISEFEKNLKSQQFRIYLQPQVDMAGRIMGAEALVRWLREDGTSVPVQRFLPVLEMSDLISRLDRHVWELAVRQLAAWKGTELEELYLSINIDPKDIYYMDIPAVLRSLCEQYGVEIKKLRVEITERALTYDWDLQGELIESLQKNGFIVEIDDFGKGSSSLSMLKDVQADVLKIDMGFLDETRNEARSKIILESVVGMAGLLNMDVVVEGVETSDQKEDLRQMGCRMYQGFLFSQPIPVEMFEKLYHRTQIKS